MDTAELLALIVVGALAGTAAASVFGYSKYGGMKNWARNILVGILGALVGGFLFQALDLSLPDILSGTMTVADMVVAFIGALIVLFVVRTLT